MNGELLCRWLGLPGQCWPPEPHILLGVNPENLDPSQLEQLVQERMAKLRGYQISHPEEATEGMNRVAQAFVTLSEAASRGTQTTTRDPLQETFVGKTTRIDWQATPPPVRRADDSGSTTKSGTISTAAPPASGAVTPLPPPARPTLVPPSRQSVPEPDTVLFHAQQSPEACRGLCSLDGLLHRIEQTRRLMIAWDRAGKYFRDPKRTLARSSEESDLTYRMERVFELIEDYPKFVGQPGQPGYRVVALTRLQMTAPMFKTMDPVQRKLLAKDWREGRRLLLAHRQYLHRRFKDWRRLPRPLRWLQRGILTFWEHRYIVLTAVAALLAFTWGAYLLLRS